MWTAWLLGQSILLHNERLTAAACEPYEHGV
jgi:hypothetical protein